MTRGLLQLSDYKETGDIETLQSCIRFLWKAVAYTPIGHSNRAGRLSCLGAALGARFDYMQQLADLDEAVTLLRKAVAITPAGHLTTEGHLDRAETLSNLGSALRTRSDRTGQPADLDEAVTCLREAVAIVDNLGYPALSPDMRSNQAGMLSNLANALRARSDRTGLAGLADLNEAVYFLRRAVAITTPAGQAARAEMLSNLGAMLRLWFDRIGQPKDLDEAHCIPARGRRLQRPGRPRPVQTPVQPGNPQPHGARPPPRTGSAPAHQARLVPRPATFARLESPC